MAEVTYSITEAVVEGWYPQIQVRDDGPITSTTITDLIEQSCSKINGLLVAAGFSPTEIESAAATDPTPYNNVRTLVLTDIGPRLYTAAGVYTVDGEEIERLEVRRDKALLDFMKRPANLGVQSSANYAPSVRSSVRYNDLSTLEEDRAKRSQFGRLVGRSSEADRKPFW